MKVLAIAAACAAVVVAAQAAETTCVSMCVEIYKPVCASDGKTYGNECRFNYEKCSTKNTSLKIVSEGECPESGACKTTNCPEIFKAVCGSNGKTYSNECELNNAKCEEPSLTVASNGTCGSSSGSGSACTEMMCLADYTPVCGSDGKTYSNECKLDNAKCSDPSLKVESQGECVTPGPKTGSMGSMGSAGSSGMDASITTGPARSDPASTPAPASSSSASTTSFFIVQIVASAALAVATTLVL